VGDLGPASTRDTIPDEAVHISGAFQLAGYNAVIATLWQVADRVAATVADEVFRRLTAADATGDIARILDDITTEQRAAYRDSPSLWAGHVYSGI
jgi:CHAT domain-containing protein